MIEVRNLSKQYNDKTVVNDVSLQIKKGKIKHMIEDKGYEVDLGNLIHLYNLKYLNLSSIINIQF